jgi:hypothetical protein
VTTVNIREPVSVRCGDGVLAFEPDGRVKVSGPQGAEQSESAPDLALSNFVEVWCDGGHAYFVGLEGRTVWFARPSEGQLTQVLKLDRLDLRDSYDPGGLHRVEFHELADGDLLIVYELGLARLGPDGKARWQGAHDQLSAHFVRIADGIAWLRGESGTFGFRLADRRPVESS